jgi:hypothetical protein
LRENEEEAVEMRGREEEARCECGDFRFPLGLGLGRDEYIEVENYVNKNIWKMLGILPVGSPSVLPVLRKHDLRKNKIIVASTTGFFRH